MIPDFSRKFLIADEEMHGLPQWGGFGNALSFHSRYWFRDSCTSTVMIPNEGLSFTAPEDGFLVVLTVHNYAKGKDYSNQEVSIITEDLATWLFVGAALVMSNGAGSCSHSDMIPVAKGDKVYYGIGCKEQDIPNAYRFWFVPALQR